jgi:threonylcarbamoyladenosine tRNA methylthiotransferase MtaB
MSFIRKKVAFHTLGCKLNFAETSTIARSFPDSQFEKVPASQKADVYVINTCSVTEAADRKCRQVIKKFIHKSPEAFIIVAGCYAQLKPGEISGIEGVDLILGVHEKFDAAKYLGDFAKRKSADIHSCNISSHGGFDLSYSSGDRTRSFLKVQDGCDYGCSYCTIPLARGNSRNPSSVKLRSELCEIAARGIKEVVLTGVNIGDYGKSDGDSFVSLLRELLKVEEITRFRISSIEPNLLTNEIIELTASTSRIVPHFHIPLQSGSNKILGLMRRRYKRELFQERVGKILSLIPFAGIGADVITGFPGEEIGDFTETYDFLAALPLSYLHVFSFSDRPGTPAETLPGKIPAHEKDRRSKTLQALSAGMHTAFMKRNIGRETDVLFENTKSNGLISGLTDNYIRASHAWDAGLAGTMRRVRLSGQSDPDCMTGELLN